MARRSSPRLLLLLVLAAVAVAVPASAVDRFGDVSATSTHRDAIGELVDAGVTAGCDPGRYCPQDVVRRDQMASFLTRSGSRTTFHHGVDSLSPGNDGVPASVTVQATGTSGGTGMVALQGSVSVQAGGNLTSCPCEVEAFIYRDSDDEQGPSSWGQLPGQANNSGRAATSVPVTWAVDIPSGSTETFRIAVFVDGNPTDVHAEGSLTAIATPHG